MDRRTTSIGRKLLGIAALAAAAGVAQRFLRGGSSPAEPRPGAMNPAQGRQVTTAPNASWETGAGEGALGFDSPEGASVTLSNPQVDDVAHLDPYYPPGSRYNDPESDADRQREA